MAGQIFKKARIESTAPKLGSGFYTAISKEKYKAIKSRLKEAGFGKQIALQEWKEGKLPSYYSSTIEKVKNYKPGANKEVDAALYYLASSVSDFSNQIPRRVKVEIGLQNLGEILS